MAAPVFHHSNKRPWRAIAEELSGEHDHTRMSELITELSAAMDEQEAVLSREQKKTVEERERKTA